MSIICLAFIKKNKALLGVLIAELQKVLFLGLEWTPLSAPTTGPSLQIHGCDHHTYKCTHMHKTPGRPMAARPFPLEPQLVSYLLFPWKPYQTLLERPNTVLPWWMRAGPATHLPLLSHYFPFHINRSCHPGRAPATHWGGTAPERQRAHRLPWSSVRKHTTGRGRECCHVVGLQKGSPPTWD